MDGESNESLEQEPLRYYKARIEMDALFSLEGTLDEAAELMWRAVDGATDAITSRLGSLHFPANVDVIELVPVPEEETPPAE